NLFSAPYLLGLVVLGRGRLFRRLPDHELAHIAEAGTVASLLRVRVGHPIRPAVHLGLSVDVRAVRLAALLHPGRADAVPRQAAHRRIAAERGVFSAAAGGAGLRAPSARASAV